MVVAIAGGHGKIGQRLARLLSASGNEVRSLIRHEAQADEVRGDGIEPVVCDLEQAGADEVAQAVGGSVDAVVFAAGAGPGSGPERKETMDYGGAVKLIAAARQNGIARYVIVSSMGADPDAPGDDTFAIYQRAKGRADEELRVSGLDFTIVRPGMLTDEPGTGAVTIGEKVGRAEVPRDDVAAVLAAVLDEPRTAGITFEVVSGDVPIGDAIRALAT
jgi:nucleoside-diphosphate-sugar epimerase